MPTNIIYTQVHENHIRNMDSMTITSVQLESGYMRVIYKSIYLIFISDVYIPIKIFCAKFNIERCSDVFSVQNINVNHGCIYMNAIFKYEPIFANFR